MGEFFQKKKNPAWDVQKVRPKSKVIRQAKKERKILHFANLMDLSSEERRICKHFQTYKWRVVLQCDNVRDERRTQNSIHGARCFSVTDGSGNVLGHYLDASWYVWRNKGHSFSVYSSQTDRSSQIVTIAK